VGVNETDSILPVGGFQLHQKNVAPADPWATLAIVHGYGDHAGRYLHFMRWLGERGVASHAIDLRGHGRSTGRRGHVRRWEEYLDDLSAFLAQPAMRSRGPLFVLGHSHGGLIVAAAVIAGVNRVAGCILSSPYFANRLPVPFYKRAFARVLNPIVPWLRIRTGLSPVMVTHDEKMQKESEVDPLMLRTATPSWYLETRRVQTQIVSEAGRFKLPLLMFIAGDDGIAEPAAADAFFQASGSTDKTLKQWPGMLHEILRERGRESAFDAILDWMRARSG
jgi:lysophospholipase